MNLFNVSYVTFQSARTKFGPLSYFKETEPEVAYVIVSISANAIYACRLSNSDDIKNFETNLKDLGTLASSLDDAVAKCYIEKDVS